MRLFTTAFCILSFQLSWSQITITVADFANAGDTVRISQTDGAGLDFATTGANFNWDYSSLTANSQYLKEYYPIGFASILIFTTYGPIAPTNYKATYFNPTNDLPLDQLSQFLPVSLSDLNQYTKRMTDSITSLGYSISVNGQGVPFKSDTIETRYKLPLNYNDNHYSRGYTFIDLNPIIDFKIKQYRQRTTTVDGWGTLITPKGTFQTLRIRHDIAEIDSVYQTFFGTGAWFGTPPIQRTEYEWWADGQLEWLLKATETNGNISAVEYQEDYLGLDASINEEVINYAIQPNPTSEFIQIQKGITPESIQIFDLNGNSVFVLSLFEEEDTQINVSGLKQGIYSIAIKTKSGTLFSRFVKI